MDNPSQVPNIRVLSSEDYALMLVVSPEGVLEIKSCKCSRQQAATWLREAADVLASKDGNEDA